MKTFKKIGLLFLLPVLTCCVFSVPQLISGQREQDILNKVVYRNYTVGDRPKLTSEQVARLYVNREISLDYNLLSRFAGDSDAETIRGNIIDLVEMLFGEDEEVCERIKSIVREVSITYSCCNSLVKIDNQPIALNFISCFGDNKEDAHLEIIYEAKTKTIIQLLFYKDSMINENTKEKELSNEKMASMIRNYYEKQLHIREAEYDFNAEYLMDSADMEHIFISCGLMHYDEKATVETEIGY